MLKPYLFNNTNFMNEINKKFTLCYPKQGFQVENKQKNFFDSHKIYYNHLYQFCKIQNTLRQLLQSSQIIMPR